MGTGMVVVVVVMMRNLRSMPLLLRIAAPWPLLLRIAAPQSSSCDAITRTLCRTCSTSFASKLFRLLLLCPWRPGEARVLLIVLSKWLGAVIFFCRYHHVVIILFRTTILLLFSDPHCLGIILISLLAFFPYIMNSQEPTTVSL
ncbi:uncharacterized protein LOC125531762 isoform X2 [Triticum urartu]|uniref:uncharacterized protein LOC125531762 isoform X2 n=1 Tax=Triticum urartu TaxID=4572 RepID=UPI002042DB11|nr:uncharacterized protein LOC125531762 isoform X2 [Triticum urartu]